MAYAFVLRACIAALAGYFVASAVGAVAEPNRGVVQSDRLAMPLGTDGPSNPILPNLRQMQRTLEAVREPASPTFLNGVMRISASVPRAKASSPALASFDKPVAALPAGQSQPARAWPRLIERNHDSARDGPIVLAALDAPAAQHAAPPTLAWAATPALPALATGAAREESVRPLAHLERAPLRLRMLSDKGGALRLPLLMQRYRVSTRLAQAMTKRGDPEWLGAALRGSGATSTDPIGDPAGALAAAQPPRPAPPTFIMPFENGRVSSLFNQGRRHPAIDLSGRHGSPVFSTSHGQTVTFAGSRGGYGNAVITRDREGREHLYGHLSAITTRVGVTLGQGDRLGSLGSTGYSTGPHVHYEVKDRRGAHINPVTLLFPRGVTNGYAWGAVARATAAQAALDPRANVRSR